MQKPKREACTKILRDWEYENYQKVMARKVREAKSVIPKLQGRRARKKLSPEELTPQKLQPSRKYKTQRPQSSFARPGVVPHREAPASGRPATTNTSSGHNPKAPAEYRPAAWRAEASVGMDQLNDLLAARMNQILTLGADTPGETSQRASLSHEEEEQAAVAARVAAAAAAAGALPVGPPQDEVADSLTDIGRRIDELSTGLPSQGSTPRDTPRTNGEEAPQSRSAALASGPSGTGGGQHAEGSRNADGSGATPSTPSRRLPADGKRAGPVLEPAAGMSPAPRGIASIPVPEMQHGVKPSAGGRGAAEGNGVEAGAAKDGWASARSAGGAGGRAQSAYKPTGAGKGRQAGGRQPVAGRQEAGRRPKETRKPPVDSGRSKTKAKDFKMVVVAPSGSSAKMDHLRDSIKDLNVLLQQKLQSLMTQNDQETPTLQWPALPSQAAEAESAGTEAGPASGGAGGKQGSGRANALSLVAQDTDARSSPWAGARVGAPTADGSAPPNPLQGPNETSPTSRDPTHHQPQEAGTSAAARAIDRSYPSTTCGEDEGAPAIDASYPSTTCGGERVDRSYPSTTCGGDSGDSRPSTGCVGSAVGVPGGGGAGGSPTGEGERRGELLTARGVEVLVMEDEAAPLTARRGEGKARPRSARRALDAGPASSPPPPGGAPGAGAAGQQGAQREAGARPPQGALTEGLSRPTTANRYGAAGDDDDEDESPTSDGAGAHVGALGASSRAGSSAVERVGTRDERAEDGDGDSEEDNYDDDDFEDYDDDDFESDDSEGGEREGEGDVARAAAESMANLAAEADLACQSIRQIQELQGIMSGRARAGRALEESTDETPAGLVAVGAATEMQPVGDEEYSDDEWMLTDALQLSEEQLAQTRAFLESTVADIAPLADALFRVSFGGEARDQGEYEEEEHKIKKESDREALREYEAEVGMHDTAGGARQNLVLGPGGMLLNI